jgi:hypothetical protein
MGMFDSVICKYKLPLNEELEKLDVDWAGADFQTKSLDCSMSLYILQEDGTLLEEVVEREYIPFTEEELKQREKEGKKTWVTWKDVVVKSKELKPLDFHGVLNFYTSVRLEDLDAEGWIEFNAYFIYGKLDKIVLVEPYKMSELRKKYEEQNKKKDQEKEQGVASADQEPRL